ncbi:hypothetical protein JCM10207_007074 [Rhodosporidiobolus poonsookiae]
MAPAQLELFKFTLYVFCPVAAMLHYGDPDWYERWIAPLRGAYRKDDIKQIEPPRDVSELKNELARLREERLARRAAKEQQPPTGSSDERAV